MILNIPPNSAGSSFSTVSGAPDAFRMSPIRRLMSENSRPVTLFKARRGRLGRAPSGRNLSNTAILPPGFSTRAASRRQATGSGITARIRWRITASNSASGRSSFWPSITRVSTPGRTGARASMAGVRSVARTGTPSGM
jgi:hypothetical protein